MSMITIGFIAGLFVSSTIHTILNERDRKRRVRQYQEFLNSINSNRVGFDIEEKKEK